MLEQLPGLLGRSHHSEKGFYRKRLYSLIGISESNLGEIGEIFPQEDFAKGLCQYLIGGFESHENKFIKYDPLIELCKVLKPEYKGSEYEFILGLMINYLESIKQKSLKHTPIRESQEIYEFIFKSVNIRPRNLWILYLFGLFSSVKIIDEVVKKYRLGDTEINPYESLKRNLNEIELVENKSINIYFHVFLRTRISELVGKGKNPNHEWANFIYDAQSSLAEIAFSSIEQYHKSFSQDDLSLARQCAEQSLKNSLEFADVLGSRDSSNREQDLHDLIALCQKFEQQNSKSGFSTQQACQRWNVWWLLFTRKQLWIRTAQRFSPIALTLLIPLIIVLVFHSCSKAPSETGSNGGGNSNPAQPSETTSPVPSPQSPCNKENNSGIWYVVSVDQARGDEFKDCPTTDSQDGRYLQVESFDERTTAREKAKEIDGCVDVEIIVDPEKSDNQLKQLLNERKKKAHQEAYGNEQEPNGIEKLSQLSSKDAENWLKDPKNQEDIEKAGNQLQDAVFYWLESIKLSEEIGEEEGESAKDTFRKPIRKGALENIKPLNDQGVRLYEPLFCNDQTLENVVDTILGED
jgi:hypothetical protein